jgi:hypothetical protein
MDAPIAPHVMQLVRLADAQQLLSHSPEGGLDLPRCRHLDRMWQVESCNARIRHEEMPHAEAMDGADKQIGGVAQAKDLQPSFQLAGAFLAIGDASHSSRRADILGQNAGELQHQRLRLAAAWAGQHNAVAG